MLSDTCFEAKEKLANALARYEDVGYPQWQIDAVVDAMKLLARVQLVNDYPNFDKRDDYEERLAVGVIADVNACLVQAKEEESKDGYI